MKKIIIPIFLFLSAVSFSQTLNSLKEDTKKMYEATYIMDYDEALNYVHPKVFETTSREQMIETLSKSFDNEGYKIRLVFPNPTFAYSELKKIDGKLLCIINYPSAMRMTFELPVSEKRVKYLEKTFKESEAYSIIKFEKERNSFYLEGKATIIAVAEKATKNKWKFVNYSLDQAALAKSILGEKVYTELGFK
jgi:hypothetical protein